MTAIAEQETTATQARGDSTVRIWTSNVVHLRQLRKLQNAGGFLREVRSGDDWGEFEVNAENFALLRAIRAKRTLSEAERAERAARLASARERRV
ncbi:hypothetical protein ACOKGD_13950 [Microbacterium phosphatis]|uniref:hypothetical protein n=1 Tax=Microbacterium phosphatis TaxID=3140248 RepID=UPI0031407ACD